MCPHPFASLDCALVNALLAVPGALAALVLALSLLLRRGRRGASPARWALTLTGAFPTSFAAAVLVSWLFVRLDLFRSHHDQRLVMVALLALTVALESLYLLACRRAR